MAFKISILLASILVASSLPSPDQSSISDQNMKIGLYSGLESFVQHPRPVRNSYPNMKYGFRVNEKTVVEKGLISTSHDLPSVNGMDNDIVINQNRNRISGNTKLVVNQIDNEIFGNSEIQVNQQGNKIGGKSPILMNIDGNNITGNSSVDVNQHGNQIGLYKKESGTTSLIPVTNAVPTTITPPIPVTDVVPTTTTSLIPVTTAVPTATTLNIKCSEADGFFTSGNQCFKFFPDSGVSWDSAKSVCQSNGLQLAKPNDAATAIALRKYVRNKYGVGEPAWIGGRGAGSGVIKWDRDGTTLSSSSSLWHPGNGHNTARASNSYCLILLSGNTWNNIDPKVYYMDPCSWPWKPLCEVVRE